jgi:hypothetical protein
VDLSKAGQAEPPRTVNPKRLAREVTRTLSQRGISTKAQDALKEALADRMAERRAISRAEREAKKERLYQLRRAKAKAKHRGHYIQMSREMAPPCNRGRHFFSFRTISPFGLDASKQYNSEKGDGP